MDFSKLRELLSLGGVSAPDSLESAAMPQGLPGVPGLSIPGLSGNGDPMSDVELKKKTLLDALGK